MVETSKKRDAIILVSLISVLILLIAGSFFVGRYPINLENIKTSEGFNIFYKIRFPRVLMAVLCGGALGISGGIFQKVFKNNLASPDIIGISSGASLGAVVAIVVFGNCIFTMQLFAFFGGIISAVFVFIIASFNKENYLFSLIISGVIISALCNSIVMFFKYTADPHNKLPSIEFWLMGGLHNIKIVQLYITSVLFLLLFAVIYKLRWKLKVISLSDDEIKSLGGNVFSLRVVFVFVATLLVSTVVSNCGVIGWVGLIAPYISKMISRIWVATSFVVGGIILLLADTFARTITTNEIPVGILISVLGAPFLIYLLIARGTKYNA